ncbi:MAG: hypothetical protein QM710_13485 [Flavobacterium sp.]
MRLKDYIIPLLLLVITSSHAQVGIGTTSPNASSILDITSANSGLLIPRVALTSTSDITTIPSPVTSLLVYNSGFSPNGFYYWNGTVWVQLTATNSNWSLTGNSGTSVSTNFLGTTDDVDLVFRRNNVRGGFIGNPGGATATTLNVKNTSFGANTLLNPSTSYRNTAIGSNVMPSNGTGFLNVSIGNQSMFSNTTGNTNTVIGVGALYSNTSGSENVALGRNALTTANASNNTALGFASLRTNASGTNNVAIGHQAGYNETGSNKLYIESSTATNGTDSSVNNALIYGEFDNRIVRTNGTLQIGNPATTGYALPTPRGTAGQFLQTDGAGGTSWASATGVFPYTTTGAATGVYNVALTQYTIRVFGTVSEIRLPTPIGNLGKIFVIIGSNGIATKIFSTAAGNIYDDAPPGFVTTLSANQRYTVQSDGTDWIVIGN